MTPTGRELLSQFGTCEICGEPATSYTVDLEEVEPEDGYKTCRPTVSHYYCSVHARRGTVRNRDGTMEDDGISPLEIKTSSL